MEVVLLLSAERDLQEAYNWVEEHRRGREQFFLQDVELRTSGAAAILDENPLADVIELKVISGSHEIRGAKPERSQKRPISRLKSSATDRSRFDTIGEQFSYGSSCP